MSAMALLTRSQFNKELEKHGFQYIFDVTEGHGLWLHKATKKHYTIPKSADGIPDSILEHYLREAGALYVAIDHPIPTSSQAMYSVKEKEECEVISMKTAAEE